MTSRAKSPPPGNRARKMKTRLRVVVRPCAAPPKAPAPSRLAVPATPFPVQSPPKLPSPAFHALVRHAAQGLQTALHHHAVAMVEIGMNPPNARVHLLVAPVRRIVPAQNAVVTVVIAKTPRSAPARRVARDRMTLSTLPSAQVHHAALALVTAPGRETAPRVHRIAQVHRAVPVLPDAPPARPVVGVRESPVAQVHASHAEWESRFSESGKGGQPWAQTGFPSCATNRPDCRIPRALRVLLRPSQP